MTSYKNLIDPHHQFSTLVARYPWLGLLERRVRRATPRDRAHLCRGFDHIERLTGKLPRIDERLVASGALKRLLDDQAERYWS